MNDLILPDRISQPFSSLRRLSERPQMPPEIDVSDLLSPQPTSLVGWSPSGGPGGVGHVTLFWSQIPDGFEASACVAAGGGAGSSLL